MRRSENNLSRIAAVIRAGFWLCLALLMAGCKTPELHQQRLVSKPNMLFIDSLVFNYYFRGLPQFEPGRAASGGAQASGCTSCR